MKLVSTNGGSEPVGLAEAIFSGLAPDGGLWTFDAIQPLAPSMAEELDSLSLPQIGLRIARHLFGGALSDDVLVQMLPAALDFDVPLVEIEDDQFTLELFHGPTLAFKDVGARFLAELMKHFINQSPEAAGLLQPGAPMCILAATSGDTGSAVAQAFWRQPGFEVRVLYPRGQVSEAQRRLFTTLGENVTALEVDGSFDDCQRMVKAAFSDRELRGQRALASANSINLGRLVPQIFYYFHARALLARRGLRERPLRIAVPSGNFGNLTAGLMAQRLGLGADRFVAATNVNDVVPEYLTTGRFKPRPSERTLSNAMDVGNPSNFSRIEHLYGGDIEPLQHDLEGHAFTDDDTLTAMREVEARTGYVLDPHTAVGWLGLRRALEARPGAVGLVLATAHPAKFADTVAEATGKEPPVPRAIARTLDQAETIVALAPEAAALRAHLLQ